MCLDRIVVLISVEMNIAEIGRCTGILTVCAPPLLVYKSKNISIFPSRQPPVCLTSLARCIWTFSLRKTFEGKSR
jgi:hypothetical protein